MNIKLLSVEVLFNTDTDVEILVKYGKILDNEDFKGLRKQMISLKEKIVKLIEGELKNG